MRKIIVLVLIFILLCFSIPVIFTKEKVEKTVSTESTENTEKTENNEYKTVKLLHTNGNEVEEMAIDEYLYGVVSAEMPASYEIEALKAQAIVARTYTIYKIENGGKHKNADICDSSLCCQAWISKEDRISKWDKEKAEENWEKIVSAVDSTKGKIITYDGKPINAFFHSNSGGSTESVENVWGGTNYPYLQAVATVRRRCLFTI